MKKDIEEKIEIPKGLELKIEKNKIVVKKDSKEISKEFDLEINAKQEGNTLILKIKQATKKAKKNFGTFIAHLKNMISGIQNNFVYRMQICSIHFPIIVNFHKERKELEIKNFLGETKPRIAKVLENVDIKIEKDIIILESLDKEAAGQSAANIEAATKIKGRDRRRFQDGIYLVDRAGKKV